MKGGEGELPTQADTTPEYKRDLQTQQDYLSRFGAYRPKSQISLIVRQAIQQECSTGAWRYCSYRSGAQILPGQEQPPMGSIHTHTHTHSLSEEKNVLSTSART